MLWNRISGRSAIIVGATFIVAIVIVLSRFNASWPLAACASDVCKEGREWLSFLVTLLVIFGGLFQYMKAQSWKRAEWLAAEVDSFLNDRKVMNALYMLDWNLRRLPLLLDAPESPKPYFEFESKQLWTALYSKSTIPRKLDKMTGRDIERSYSEVELSIRDCFDQMLGRLERFDMFIKSGWPAPGLDDTRLS